MIGHINSAALIWSKWMGNMFWQVGLLIILIIIIDMAIRRRVWPHVRYVLWGMVFLKLLIPPAWHMPTGIVSSIQPTVSQHIPVQIEYKVLFDIGTPTSGITEIEQNQDSKSVPAEKATWQTTLFLIWIAGMLFFALMLVIQLSRLPKRSQRRRARNVPELFSAALGSASMRLRLKKIPAVIFSRKAKSPAVYGLFRPVLLLPVGYFDHLTREQAEHVLLHELCHIKRGDLWVHWFCILLQIVYWFNPLLILARRRLGHVSEICCDLSVADVLKEKTAAYRETLLITSRRLLTDAVLPGIGLLGIFEEPSRIIARLKWLEKKTWGHRKRKLAAALVTGLIMAVFVMPMAGLSQSNDIPNEDVVYQIDETDTAPTVLRAFLPAYPLEAKKNGITGRVVVQFVVTKEGVSRDEWIFESEPPDVFNEAALESIRWWRFVPGTRNGEPVEVRVNQPIVFTPDGFTLDGGPLDITGPALPPEYEELKEIPHYFVPSFTPEPNQKVDTPPIPSAPPPMPQYPLSAARDKIEGRVVLKFVVDTDGKVKNPEVVGADPEGVFEQSALTNIEQFEFIPATLDGEPVPCMMNYTIGFKLY